ncbi:MAG: PilZ domain-containing protein [Candidatus Omnitrophica bacterium]|nr:PilZ domain-containing protein [Candidatus Omnitrophota bacterium]
MAKDTGFEKRKFVRIPEEDLVVCEPLDLTGFGGATHMITKRMHVFTKSLSAGGILFGSDQLFEIGALLKLELDIPGWEKYKPSFYKGDEPSGRHPLVVIGKVVRVEDVGKGQFDIGVAFAAMDSGHKLALKKYLSNK